MSDFTSGFWSVFIIVVSLIGILSMGVLLWANSKRRPTEENADTTGHVWDEDLKELNKPLPRWWMWMFYITIVFSLIYLIFYPGLGNLSGTLGWSSVGEYQAEMARADKQYGPMYAAYLKQDIKTVADDPQASVMGQRLFANHCAQCHGSDAGGTKGFPSLIDNDWLYGGSPEAIKTSIAQGRNGVMPALKEAVGGDQGVTEVAHYVLSLSGREHDKTLAPRGKEKFATACAACHNVDGKGNQGLGAPNLTDKVWLHGGSLKDVTATITAGRNSHMPAHADILNEAKIHLLTAYLYRMGQDSKAAEQNRKAAP